MGTDIEKLKALFANWTDHFAGNDPNSVVNQIRSMVRSTLVFRLINESRRFAPPRQDKSGVELNGLIHQTIDCWYAASQTAALRRLVDRRKDVFSLCRLLMDLKSVELSMTRQHLLAAHNLPYDVATADDNGDIADADAYARHDQMDMMCGIDDVRQRQPGDRPSKGFFQGRITELEQYTEDIKQYVNKYIAHAAPSSNRQQPGRALGKVTYEKLWTAERAICRLASFVSLLVDSTHRGWAVIAQYDVVEFLDRPIVPTEHLGEIRDAWKKWTDEVNSWQWSPGELLIATS